MMREDVKGKEELRSGDLVLFEAVPSPGTIIGRLLRTGELVDVTELKFTSVNDGIGEGEYRGISTNEAISYFFYWRVGFICQFSDGQLKVLTGVELLDLIIYPDAERNRGKIDKDIVKKPHLQPFFDAFEYKDEGD
jgi:hypothetical protein